MTTKICIGVPSGDMVQARFCTALLALFHRTAKSFPLVYTNYMSSRITQNRNDIALEALKNDCTHLLYIDSDMVFPEDALLTLLAHDKDIVCATTTKREENFPGLIGKPVDPADMTPKKRIFEMERVGMPFMLIKTSVFEKLPQPWFAEPIIDGVIMPEDYYFCQQARDAGYRIWCDLVVSLALEHLGIKAYKPKAIPQPDIGKVA